jgi:PncC family amidohydrolase
LKSARLALEKEAARLAKLLLRRKVRVVLTESCTGGMAAAALVATPGISEQLCGSAVVYRNDTKARWLGVSRANLKHPGAVSRIVAEQMARGVLKRTPEANLAGAITGHLNTGLLFVGVAKRGARKVWVQEFRIEPVRKTSSTLRVERQLLASNALLFMLRSLLEFS